jgi:hypothetical protein
MRQARVQGFALQPQLKIKLVAQAPAACATDVVGDKHKATSKVCEKKIAMS